MGSGHLRTLGFARYLPAAGWKPIVLTAHAFAYPRADPIPAGVVPDDCPVHRAPALDVSRHLAIAGKYPAFLARPDRWASWWPGGVLCGLRLIRRHRVRAIWSTYPIMTAHRIARTLSRITHLPWIADFRDPVASSVSPANPHSVAAQFRMEADVMRDASAVTFTTPGAMRDYAQRYPGVPAGGRLHVIENGYDETAFQDLPEGPLPLDGRPVVLLHSGLLYPDGRNPLPFFTALARLNASGALSEKDVQVVLRASGSHAEYAREIERLGLARIVTLAPAISNHDALVEQAQADALLLFQGSRFNRQIPAKVYEYLRIGRPILALVDAQGDTAALLRNAGAATLFSMDDIDGISTGLPAFVEAVRDRSAPVAPSHLVPIYARSAGALQLAECLDAFAGVSRVAQ